MPLRLLGSDRDVTCSSKRVLFRLLLVFQLLLQLLSCCICWLVLLLDVLVFAIHCCRIRTFTIIFDIIIHPITLICSICLNWLRILSSSCPTKHLIIILWVLRVACSIELLDFLWLQYGSFWSYLPWTYWIMFRWCQKVRDSLLNVVSRNVSLLPPLLFLWQKSLWRLLRLWSHRRWHFRHELRHTLC